MKKILSTLGLGVLPFLLFNIYFLVAVCCSKVLISAINICLGVVISQESDSVESQIVLIPHPYN